MYVSSRCGPILRAIDRVPSFECKLKLGTHGSLQMVTGGTPGAGPPPRDGPARDPQSTVLRMVETLLEAR